MLLAASAKNLAMEMEFECSDSSNDTIIVSSENIGGLDSPEQEVESEIIGLLGKYLNDSSHRSESSSSKSVQKTSCFDSLSHTNLCEGTSIETSVFSEIMTRSATFPCYDSDENLPTFERYKLKEKNVTSGVDICGEPSTVTHGHEENIMSGLQDNVGKKRKCVREDSNQKETFGQKELKKQEQQSDKMLKDALVKHYKNYKPENCLKFVKAHVDVEITTKDYWKDVVNEFEKADVSFTAEPQQAASIISWIRKSDSFVLGQDGQLVDTSKALKIEEILVIMESNDFIMKINEESLIPYIESLCVLLKGAKMILAIYGLNQYYKCHSSRKAIKIIKGESQKINSRMKDLPIVSRRSVEYVLTEVQLLYNVGYRMVETKRDMALMVLQLTKSIAQMPYKLEKQEKFMQTKWFMSEDNKNCIRVDRNGNGLSRLWKQIITSFPLASLETAEAISAIYPTPSCLMKAYNNVANTTEGENLLRDVPIRRTAGPISTMRKVGPELSKKLYLLFTSLDPDMVL